MSSRSMSRCTRCATSSVMSPSFRSDEHGHPLGVEQFAAQPLVENGALLGAVVVLAGEPRGEAVRAEPVLPARALERVVVRPAFLGDLLDPCERRFGRLDARLRVLAVRAAVVLDPDQPDDPRQRDDRPDQRDEDDDERHEDDHVALREAGREGERGRERHRAADARPRDHGRRLPRRVRVALADAPEEEARHVGEDRHPDDPDHDDGGDDRERLADQRRRDRRAAHAIVCSCRPTSANSSALTRKTRISQNESPDSRVCTVVSSGVYQPM